jgi:ribosomal protein L12E/L44/L45/RPP1/RPP2
VLAQIYAGKGDNEAALASVRRALEIEPDNRWARRILQQLEAAP